MVSLDAHIAISSVTIVRPAPQTSRGYFGSPHLRGTISSTGQLWSETLGEDREAVLKALSAKELKRREVGDP